MSKFRAVLAGLVTVAGTSDVLKYVGRGVKPPPRLLKRGSKAECLAHIKEVWTDMRPLSLRKQRSS